MSPGIDYAAMEARCAALEARVEALGALSSLLAKSEAESALLREERDGLAREVRAWRNKMLRRESWADDALELHAAFTANVDAGWPSGGER